VGPQLAGLLVFLGLRMRLSRARIREGLMELFGLMLSTGVIDETIREAGHVRRVIVRRVMRRVTTAAAAQGHAQGQVLQ